MLTAGILLVICALTGAGQANSGGFQFDANDCQADVPELISNNGYPVEVHDVVTSDGYILQLHRIPYGRNSQENANANRPVVLLMHGLLSSSADFIASGAEDALGYILADAGYDTWLGNSRGNYYSRRHVSMNPNSNAFWDFTWEQMGRFDLPAMIDYILNIAGKPALHYAGHSQGTTDYYVLNSMIPEYNAKISTAHMMAPVAGLQNMEADVLRQLAPLSNIILTTARLTGISEEILPRGGAFIVDADGNMVCDPTDSIAYMLCQIMLDTLIGPNEFDQETLNNHMCQMPAASSLKQFIHYLQSIDNGFRRWSFGAIGNLANYGSFNAPLYNLNNVDQSGLFHYYSTGDALTAEKDIDNLRVSFPSATFYKIDDLNFSHIDFAWSTEARSLVYDKIIDHMNSYEGSI